MSMLLLLGIPPKLILVLGQQIPTLASSGFPQPAASAAARRLVAWMVAGRFVVIHLDISKLL